MLGSYELLVRLATGGAANVFLALDGRTGGFVALKVLLPSLAKNEDFLRMFFTEARVAAQLRHPNIVTISGFGEVEGVHALAMEYVFGASLAQVLRASARAKQPLSVGVILAIVAKVCDALEYAHGAADEKGRSLKLVHRDVTPQNILVGFNGVPKLTDFGIAKATDRGWETKAGIVKGKFSYMSPEQAQGDALDRRSDVFSLGIVLWEALTGQDLFKGGSPSEVLGAIRKQTIPAPSEVVPGLTRVVDPIVSKALQRHSRLRYPSAAAMAQEIRELIERAGMRLDEAAVSKELAGVYGETILTRGRALRRAMKSRIEPRELAEALEAHPIEAHHLPHRSSSSLGSSPRSAQWEPAPEDALLAQVGTDDIRSDALVKLLGIEEARGPSPEGWVAGSAEVAEDSIVPELRTLSAEAPEHVDSEPPPILATDPESAPIGGAAVSRDLQVPSEVSEAALHDHEASPMEPLTGLSPSTLVLSPLQAGLAALACGLVGFLLGALLL
ncbi:MAG: serine/threonine-protein kinase [Myxococcota bacterium]